MGEWYCSRFAIMQLFHELKQQFPTLPDHVVSRCIAQNNYDKETCARSLRATEESRPPPGAFPPPPPRLEPAPVSGQMDDPDSPIPKKPAFDAQQRYSLGPLSLEIGTEIPPGPPTAPLTIDVACCPIEDPEVSNEILREFSIDNDDSLLRPALIVLDPSATSLPVLHEEVVVPTSSESPTVEEPERSTLEIDSGSSTSRGLTSINLTLRPPTSEFRMPATPADPEKFQSNLNVSIGRGNFSNRFTSARVRPPPVPQRPSSLVYPSFNVNQATGLPLNRLSQALASSVSAPTTPSFPGGPGLTPAQPSSSLPTTPSLGVNSSTGLPGPSTNEVNRGAIPRRYEVTCDEDVEEELTPESLGIYDEVEEQYKPLIKEQLVQYKQLDKALGTEKEKLENLRKEVEDLKTRIGCDAFFKNTERQLKSEIYQLQVECDKLTEQIDRRSDSQIPLGETNEEFYQSIYTGQQFNPDQLDPEPSNTIPPRPPLPSQPPAWRPEPSRIDSQEDPDGPSWVCPRCTFDNHPLMNGCEECDLPKPISIGASQGEIPDIRIRVTRHHNFSPRRTVHNWVV